jgi:hypothetical protein
MIEWKDVLAAARRTSPGIFAGMEAVDEGEHFYRCRHCGQAVDYRELGDVLYHDRAGHGPLLRR